MQHQLPNRLCAPLILDVMERFCNKTIDAKKALETLRVSQSRLYTLRTEYLRAKANGTLNQWTPGQSGGNRASELPPHAEQHLRRALAEGYNHAFAASELQRLFGVETTRWSMRRFAKAQGLDTQKQPVRIPAHTRRWQRMSIGEVWQLDATPHRWFGPEHPAQPLFDVIDDASRLQVGIRLCRAETLADYIDFLRAAFEKHGLPLGLYVDNATVFRSPVDGNLTALGQRLRFYGVSLLFASTPQAKGKVERVHQVWQDRLPPFFRLHGITPETDLAQANAMIEALALQRNEHESHRELGMTPRRAWDAAREAGRDKLRPVPRDGWWPFVWSLWRNRTVGTRGNVYHDALIFPTQLKQGQKVILCEHSGGHFSVLHGLPGTTPHPKVAFTNLPAQTPFQF